MNSICCCQCGDDFEEFPTNTIYRHCLCLRFFFHQLFSGAKLLRVGDLAGEEEVFKTPSINNASLTYGVYNELLAFTVLLTEYGALFQRIEGLPVSSPIQGTASASGVGFALPTSLNEENHSAVRPLPYDAENRFTRLQRGLVSRREKAMTHFQEDSQALRRSMSSSGMEFLDFAKRRSGIDSTEDSKCGPPESLEKSSTVKATEGLLYEHSSDNEDVCPTCLEEYTSENPKIVTQCSHHFHLGCIYEWMERSDTCPMCGKVMEFCESP